METIDDEITEGALAFIDKAHKDGHAVLRLVQHDGDALPHPHRREDQGKSGGQGDYTDRMVEHDENIGKMLDKLDELGIADDTIVIYSTDNGPHYNSWPDAGITPFAHEKDTNWEGGWRVPAFARWPGQFKAGTVLNGIVTHQDWAGHSSPRPGCRTSRRSCSRASARRQDLQGAPRQLQHAAVPDGRSALRARGSPSSTSAMTGTSWRSASATGR